MILSQFIPSPIITIFFSWGQLYFPTFFSVLQGVTFKHIFSSNFYTYILYPLSKLHFEPNVTFIDYCNNISQIVQVMKTLPDLHNFKLMQLQTQLKKAKRSTQKKKKIFELHFQFSLLEWKVQWNEGGGRSCCGWSGSIQCVGVWISDGLPCVYTYSWPYVYLILTSTGPSGS